MRRLGEEAFRAVGLDVLAARGSGRSDVRIALLDGPVDEGRLSGRAESIGGARSVACAVPPRFACRHATHLAALLAGCRDVPDSGICPGCTLLVRPIFKDTSARAAPADAATAIADAVADGAHVVLLAAVLRGCPSTTGADELLRALDFAAAREVLVVAAAGNDATLSGSVMTQHPWVLPVAARTPSGDVWPGTTLSVTIARRGLSAPGTSVPGYEPHGDRYTGTSVAATLVAGAIALLWSGFAGVHGRDLRAAVRPPGARSLVPPLLDAAAAYVRLAASFASVN